MKATENPTEPQEPEGILHTMFLDFVSLVSEYWSRSLDFSVPTYFQKCNRQIMPRILPEKLVEKTHFWVQ